MALIFHTKHCHLHILNSISSSVSKSKSTRIKDSKLNSTNQSQTKRMARETFPLTSFSQFYFVPVSLLCVAMEFRMEFFFSPDTVTISRLCLVWSTQHTQNTRSQANFSSWPLDARIPQPQDPADPNPGAIRIPQAAQAQQSTAIQGLWQFQSQLAAMLGKWLEGLYCDLKDSGFDYSRVLNNSSGTLINFGTFFPSNQAYQATFFTT